jgi:hypothetical protein
MVYGLGISGEGAYKDALRRLKATCGSRSVMRAVHLKKLNREEAPKGNPASFLRYAEKVRTILFNLSYIGETRTSSSDWPRNYRFRIGSHGTMAVGVDWNTGQSTSLGSGYACVSL